MIFRDKDLYNGEYDTANKKKKSFQWNFCSFPNEVVHVMSYAYEMFRYILIEFSFSVLSLIHFISFCCIYLKQEIQTSSIQYSIFRLRASLTIRTAFICTLRCFNSKNDTKRVKRIANPFDVDIITTSLGGMRKVFIVFHLVRYN